MADAAFVHVDMGDLRDLRVHALSADDIPVVLRGDEYPAGVQIFDRVVGAPVAEAHLFRFGASRQRHQLMPQTDGKHGDAGRIELFDLSDDGHIIRRVARPVGEHDTVKLLGQYLYRRSVGGKHRDLAAPLLEAADHVFFYAEVH